LQKF
jgi:hypothetical protein